MIIDIYNYINYKDYLLGLTEKAETRKITRKDLSQICQCHTTYISQVLNGMAHLSLEQAHKLNHYFEHDALASRYFLLMVQLARSGTKELSDYFESELQGIRNERQMIKTRLSHSKKLSSQQEKIYYSSWIYSAIHVAVEISGLQTPEDLAQYFMIDTKRVKEVIEFLYASNLVHYENGKYMESSINFHLGEDSPNIKNHHTNWRLKSIASLDQNNKKNLHYSAVACVSKEDYEKIRKALVDGIEHIVKTASTGINPPQEVVAIGVDFFQLHS